MDNTKLDKLRKIADFLIQQKLKIALLGLISILTIVVFNSLFAERLELMTYDLRARLNMKSADPNIVIVTIDNTSINEIGKMGYGRWPFPRGIYADVLKIINSGKPQAIVFDIRFEDKAPEWDNNPELSDKRFIEGLKNIPNLFFIHHLFFSKKDLEKNHTKIEEEVLKRDNITLDQYINKLIDLGPGNLIQKLNYNDFVVDETLKNNAVQSYLIQYSLKKHLEGIYQSAKNIVISNIIPDDLDKTVRSVQPVYIYDEKYLFSVGLALAHFVNGEKDKVIIRKNLLQFGNTTIPLTKEQQYYLNFRKKSPINKNFLQTQNMIYNSFPFVGFFGQNKNKLNPDIFKDKIVIIGLTSDFSKDTFKIPGHKNFFGPEIIALRIDNLLNDNHFIKRGSFFVNILIKIFLCIMVILIFIVYPLGKSSYLNVFYCLMLILLYFFLNILMFVKYFIWMDLVSPIFSAGIVTVLMIAVSLFYEKEKRSLVENTFSKYVSPQVYKKLLDDYKNVDLKTYREEITVLFSDIRGFTPFTEDLTPEEVSKYLNEYFTEMVEVILQHNGTIDKFMGDAIMAFFGAPVPFEDHALQAAKAALAMMESLQKLNEKWSNQGRRLINIGIGLNSGSALVGNFGSPRLMDYTVIGDTVNLGSRLESLNKETDTNILISAYTYQYIKDQANVRIIGPKTVKGKSEAVVVYELLGLKNPGSTDITHQS